MAVKFSTQTSQRKQEKGKLPINMTFRQETREYLPKHFGNKGTKGAMKY